MVKNVLAACVIGCAAAGAHASSFSIAFENINVTTGFGMFLYTASGSATFNVNDDFDPTKEAGLGNWPFASIMDAPHVEITTSDGITYLLNDAVFNDFPLSGEFVQSGPDPSLGLSGIDTAASTSDVDFYDVFFGSVLVKYSDVAAIVSQSVGSMGSVGIELEFGSESYDATTDAFDGVIGEFGVGTATYTVLESAPAAAPVPLPASLPLLGLAGTVLVAVRRSQIARRA